MEQLLNQNQPAPYWLNIRPNNIFVENSCEVSRDLTVGNDLVVVGESQFDGNVVMQNDLDIDEDLDIGGEFSINQIPVFLSENHDITEPTQYSGTIRLNLTKVNNMIFMSMYGLNGDVVKVNTGPIAIVVPPSDLTQYFTPTVSSSVVYVFKRSINPLPGDDGNGVLLEITFGFDHTGDNFAFGIATNNGTDINNGRAIFAQNEMISFSMLII